MGRGGEGGNEKRRGRVEEKKEDTLLLKNANLGTSQSFYKSVSDVKHRNT